MAKKLSLIDNKVVRRITVSFILAALIPIGIVGFLSFQQVRELFRDQSSNAMQQNCKDYATSLIDRLNLAESTLRLVGGQVEISSGGYRLIDLDKRHNLINHFAGLAVIAPNGTKTELLKGYGQIPEISDRKLQVIGLDKPHIKTVTGLGAELSQLWIAINLVENHPESGVLLGKIKADYLWDRDSIRSNDIWVINNDGQLLFASISEFNLPPEAKAQIFKTNSGRFVTNEGGQPYLGAYWKIPMKGMFYASDFIVVLAQPESLAFESIQQFVSIYPPLIVLAILVVAFFITRLIVKYLSPLGQLKAATLKIADGDFHTQVNVNSHDEFEALADSFNEMTRRLRGQFEIMATMAEIDRHILSSLNADDIVETALNRLPTILFCDLISIAKVDPETYRVSNIHTRRGGQAIETTAEPLKLGLQDILDLLASQDSVIEIESARGKFSAYLQVLGNLVNWRYLIVPIVVNGTLSSMICAGYKASKPIPPEALSAARNFGDRIAVALSNAAWEEKLYQQAHYDALTGLPNRLVLNDRLAQELVRARRDKNQVAVIFIDLDRFKNINDSLGHSAGDELLVQVSQAFVNCVRETDLVVRLGGDEFVMVLPELNSNASPVALVTSIAEKILSSLRKTYIVAGQPMTFTASLGIAMFPGDADTSQDLLKNADAAMYHAKGLGRANFQFYSSELNATALENIKLEHELRNAISKEELVVHYQPKVNLSGKIVGAEALVRWQHKELGMVSPATFIPIAEQSGFIVDIGEWVLAQACLLINSIIAQNLEPIRVSINLSAIEFKRADLVERVAEIISRTCVDPKYIELELTESVAIGEAAACIQRMNELKGLGLMLAMDDFGTGFSSLSYLKELPLDVLKIDQSFMRQLESQSDSQAIVRAILALAHGLGMEAIAEGVETKAQLEFLEQHQCSVFQGYFFSRPVSRDAFLKLLVKGYLPS